MLVPGSRGVLPSGPIPITADDIAQDWVALPIELALAMHRSPRPPGMLEEELREQGEENPAPRQFTRRRAWLRPTPLINRDR